MAYDRGMGPNANGWSPPFSPSGRSSIWRVAGPGYTPLQMSHEGVLVRFEADADRLAELIPKPLEPTERTGEVGLFVNISRMVPTGFPDDSDERRFSNRFHEALFIFPCRLGDQEYMWHWIMYTDSDWAMYTGFLAGLHSKIAQFKYAHMLPPHPLKQVEAEGAVVEARVSLQDRPLIDVRFKAQERVDPDVVFADAAEIIGMRYFPDHANRVDDRPLAHELVIYDMVDQWTAGDAWSGEAELSFGDQASEELHYFTPKRILSAHHIAGFGYTNRGPKILYDYLADR